MTQETLIEQRLAAIERTLEEIKQRLDIVQRKPNWTDRVQGIISDREAFEEALEYGRQFRQSDRPADDDGGEEVA
jgi:hypothetical protein